MSLNEVITNNTNQVWTLDSADTYHLGSGVHWGQRPVQELDRGQSETAQAPTGGRWHIDSTFTLSNSSIGANGS